MTGEGARLLGRMPGCGVWAQGVPMGLTTVELAPAEWSQATPPHPPFGVPGLAHVWSQTGSVLNVPGEQGVCGGVKSFFRAGYRPRPE